MQFHMRLPLVLVLISLTTALADRALSIPGIAPPTVTVVAGDGLLLRPTQDQSILTVLVRNGYGQPVAGAAVNWTLAGAGAISSTQSITDSTGRASNQYTAQTVFGVNFTQSVVTASSLGVDANMKIATSGVDQSDLDNPFVTVQL